jgi:hypothetical protein
VIQLIIAINTIHLKAENTTSELKPSGVLALAVTYYSRCSVGSNFYVKRFENDLVFRNCMLEFEQFGVFVKDKYVRTGGKTVALGGYV